MTKREDCQEAPDYVIHTSPEMEALGRAAADGKHGRNYRQSPYDESISHAVPGSTHYVHLSLTAEEEAAGVTSTALEQLAHEQDADAVLAFLYIARILAPPMPLTQVLEARPVISFDDVLTKIGWSPRSTAERREMHKRVYAYIRYGERAQVVGTRRGKYKDKHTGELIPTQIQSSLWRIMAREMPEQQSLYPETETPFNVKLAISDDWAKLLSSPQTAQYLPLGEKLGAIAGNKPSGAWARVIGLSLASFWRRLPREVMDGSVKPTRRELLERYPPKTGPVTELLASKNPQFAITYWCGAIEILTQEGFLAKEGEATIDAKEMRAALPRQDWAQAWFDAKVDLHPGPLMAEAIQGRVASLPVAVPKKRRGRPKKET